MKLSEMPRWTVPYQDDRRNRINIHPEAHKALVSLLHTDPWIGIGYSEFIMRAVRRAREEEKNQDQIPFHRFVGFDDPSSMICARCGYRKDRAVHDEKTAARHGGFQEVSQ